MNLFQLIKDRFARKQAMEKQKPKVKTITPPKEHHHTRGWYRKHPNRAGGKGLAGNKLAKKCRKFIIFRAQHPGLFKLSTNRRRRYDRKRAAIAYALAHQAA